MLPTFVVIGAMKCGTTALHAFLAGHPEVGMSEPKELNFFIGPEEPEDGWSWERGNWHRGPEWYAAQFPDAPARGETSPSYTSPAYPYAAERIAALIPDVLLIYMVRDPIARAVSQYRHHRSEGTEPRELADALLDPASQYIARSRFHERLEPYLERFRRERLLICAQEELLGHPRATLAAVCAFLGVEPWAPADARATAPAPWVRIEPGLRARLEEALADDAERLRALAGREFEGWMV